MRCLAILSTALVMSGAVTVGCGGDERDALPAHEAAALLENRNWIDHWPQSADEKLFVYRFTPQMGGGVFQDRTLFKGQFELFVYEIKGDEIRIQWPHTKQRDRVRFHIESVKGPKPFDLRLVLDGASRGPTVYYGRSRETHAESLMIGP